MGMTRLVALALLVSSSAWAQCIMCARTAAAQNAERAKVLNFGILVMLIPPVLILTGFLLLAWRRNKVQS